MEKRYLVCVRVYVCIVYIMEIWRRYSVLSIKTGITTMKRGGGRQQMQKELKNGEKQQR